MHIQIYLHWPLGSERLIIYNSQYIPYLQQVSGLLR